MPGGASPFASSGSSGGGASPFATGGSSGVQGPHDQSIFDAIVKVFTQGAADFKDVALGLPAGIYESGKVGVEALGGNPDPAIALAKAFGAQLATDVRHPLRHPGYTLLDLLPFVSGGAGAVARLGEAGRAASVGEDALRAFVRNPAKSERVITSPTGATAKGHYSRSGLGYSTQRVTDALLQGAKPGSRRETLLNKRISKWNDRRLRVEEALAQAASNRLWEAGKRLDNTQSQALRFVAEKLPLQQRLTADATRLDEARANVGQRPGQDARTVKKLEDRLQWGHDAVAEYLQVDADGLPVFKDTPEAQKLAGVYGLMQQVVGEREEILKALDLMDDAKLHGAKVRTGRLVMGARYVEPTAARMGNTPRLRSADYSLRRLERQFQRAAAREAGMPEHVFYKKPRSHDDAVAHLSQLTRERNKALRYIAEGMFGPIDKREVAMRNTERGKLKRIHKRTQKSLKLRGMGSTKLVLPKTVWEERLAEAEAQVQSALERRPDEPAMKRWAERDDEIDKLSEALNPSPEEVFGGESRAGKPDLGHTLKKVKRQPSKGFTRLEGAVALARKERARAAEVAARRMEPVGVVGFEDLQVPEDALHIGYQREGGKAPSRAAVSSTGTAGHTRDFSLRESKGASIQYGLYEPNVAKLLAIRGKGAVKLKMLARKTELARKGGTLHPTRRDDVWVWNDDEIVSQKKIPPSTKVYLSDPDAMATADEATELSHVEEVRQNVMRWARNDDWNLDPIQRADLEEEARLGRGVFVQRSLLGDFGRSGPMRVPYAKTADMLNNVQKSLVVYFKANYPVIQAMSNAAMNVIQQGFATPRNGVRAVELWRNEPRLAADIGDVMGSGAVMQAAFEGTGRVASVTQKLAHWMSHWVDGPARLSAFLHEASKAGFNSPAELRSLLNDETHVDALGEVAQRAKEAIVDYSEMTDAEKNVIRRIFFVYPWLKGSVKWTSHFLRDHPIQASALGHVGNTGAAVSRAEYPSLPSYLQGAFAGPGGGLINPSGVNPFQTPEQIGSAIAGLANRTPQAPLAGQFFTPALATLVALATGRDTLGRPLPPGLPQVLRQLYVTPTPAVQALHAASEAALGQQGPVDALLGRPSQSTFPNPNDPLYRFLLGGLYPRGTSQQALARVAGLEQSGR